jgi:hypothetical protein
MTTDPRAPDDLTLEDVSRLAAPFLRLWWSRRSRLVHH